MHSHVKEIYLPETGRAERKSLLLKLFLALCIAASMDEVRK